MRHFDRYDPDEDLLFSCFLCPESAIENIDQKLMPEEVDAVKALGNIRAMYDVPIVPLTVWQDDGKRLFSARVQTEQQCGILLLLKVRPATHEEIRRFRQFLSSNELGE